MSTQTEPKLVTQIDFARAGQITPQMKEVAEREHRDPEYIRERVADGRIAIPANIVHIKKGMRAFGVGEGLSTKVNVNLGISGDKADAAEEWKKVKIDHRHPERHARDGCQEPVAFVGCPAGAGLGFENVLAHEARLSCSYGATERRASRCGVFSKPGPVPACGNIAGGSWASLAGRVPLLKWTWPKGPLAPVTGSRLA